MWHGTRGELCGILIVCRVASNSVVQMQPNDDPANNMSSYQINSSTRHAVCNPRNPDFFQNPYPFYAELHKKCPAFFWEDYGHWCFTSWDDVNALLRDKRFGRQILHIATRKELDWPDPLPHTKDFDAIEAHSLLMLEPPEHTRLRTLVNRAFVSRQVERLRPRIETLANELIDGFEDKAEIELLESFAAPLPVLIISEMLGVPAHMAPQLLSWSHDMVAMFMFGRNEEIEHTANAASHDFIAYLKELADEKRKNPGEDLISYMITTEHRGQKLTDAELISTTILLLNAGHEATVHQAGNGIKSILESNHDPKSLFTTPEQTEKTVAECLRFDAPLHIFNRYALSDIELEGGITLKKGDEIGLMFGAANRDPKRFAHPDAFDPARPNQANISFGAGIHFCIGAPLARIELQTALKILFDRLPNLRLAEPPAYANSYHFHGLEKLRVSWS